MINVRSLGKLRISILPFVIVFAAFVIRPTQAAAASAQSAPRASCARSVNDDAVRPVPPALIADAHRLFPFVAEPEALAASTVYRCMGGAVWLCNHGANLTCARADVRRASPGAQAFCRDNPGASVVPMVARGHDTIYSWTCEGRKARINGAGPLDPRGFIAGQWSLL